MPAISKRQRRQLIASATLAVAILTTAPNTVRADTGEFVDYVRELEQTAGGRIGVYAVDAESGNALSYRSDERFAMASTFKPLLAAAVLARVDRGELSLSDRLPVADVEIQSYSPILETLAGKATISIAELCKAAVSVGDNTASNMLLDQVGGPAGLTAYLRQNGDALTRLDRYETALNENATGDPRDTTTPRAIVRTLLRTLQSSDLSANSRALLRQWMIESTTGSRRIRAGLPQIWTIGDKTGTGLNGAVNNVAIAWTDNGDMLGIAVYLTGSTLSPAELEGFHKNIGEWVARLLQETAP